MSTAPPPSTGPSGPGSPPPKGNGPNNQRRNNRRSNNRDNNNRTTGNNNTHDSKLSFKGSTKGMNGHVFSVYHESTDKRQFSKTIKALQLYVGGSSNFKYADDLEPLFRSQQLPDIPKPSKPDTYDSTNEVDVQILKQEVAEYMERRKSLRANLRVLWNVIWGQCTEALQAELQALPAFTDSEYPPADGLANCAWLLTQIKNIRTRFASQSYAFSAAIDAYYNLFTFRQNDLSDTEYYEQFKELTDLIHDFGGDIGTDALFKKTLTDNYPKELTLSFPTDASKAATPEPDATSSSTGTPHKKKTPPLPMIDPSQVQAKERALAALFIKNASNKYNGLKSDLRNQFSRGTDQYPTSVVHAYQMLVNYEPPRQHKPKDKDRPPLPEANQPPPTHPTGGPPPPSTDGAPTSSHEFTQLSFPANQFGGHFSFAQLGHHFFFAQPAPHAGLTGCLPKTWVLLDTGASSNIFCNASFLSNIRPSAHPHIVHTNGGTHTAIQVGDVTNFGTVWFSPHSIANVLSFYQVQKRFRITIDTHSDDPAFNVHRPNGTIMRFFPLAPGIYAHDTLNPEHNPNDSCNHLFLQPALQTTDQRAAAYSPSEQSRAEQALALYHALHCPSKKDFLYALQHNSIRDCPLSEADGRRLFDIYGTPDAVLKGRTVKGKSKRVYDIVPKPVPQSVLNLCAKVTLCVDIFYVHGILFMHTIAKMLTFRTIAVLPNRRKPTLLSNLQDVLRMYVARGFTIGAVESDNEFACLKPDLLPINLNVTAKDDHVPEVERSIRTVKERHRTCLHGLPYKRIPAIMIIAAVTRANASLNQLPRAESKAMPKGVSIRETILGIPDPGYHELSLPFGQYCQVYEDPDPPNTTAPRTLGAIALHPTGNAQGSHYFMSLRTGQRISRQQWDILPITPSVVRRVEAIAEAESQPLVPSDGLAFLRVDGTEFGNNNETSPTAQPHDDSQDDKTEERIEAAETEEHAMTDDVKTEQHDTDDDAPNEDNAPHSDESLAGDETVSIADEPPVSTPIENQPDNDSVQTDKEQSNDVQDTPESPSSHSYNLRTNRNLDYSHRLDHKMDSPISGQQYAHFSCLQAAWDETVRTGSASHVHRYVTHFMMTQMTAKAGIRKHGQAAINALMKEFAQLHNQETFDPVHAHELTKQQREAALRSVNLIKEKRNGDIKGRSCADGRKQRALYTKGEMSSPTLSSESLLMLLCVDAIEERDTAFCDVAGAYLNALMKDLVHMKLTGEVVDIMCSLDSSYREYVVTENGKKTLYVRLVKALYGCIQSALRWYELFSSTLVKQDFALNPYDACVANKIVDGKQLTVAWYVDDLKISHCDADVVTSTITFLESKFGKMTVTRGKEHEYIGMKIRFNGDKTVSVSMAQHIDEALAAFPETISKATTTPAKKDLFEIDETSDRLDPQLAEVFHSVTAKLLFTAQRARIDILLPVAFLCTRVSHPTDQDWQKLKRVLQYLLGTRDLELILGMNAADGSFATLTAWVDASYGVHPDKRSHTGGTMSFGRGAFSCKSKKQKINTKSSTEAEVVGASDYLPNMLWAKNFLEAQGISLANNNIVFNQDNQSAIRLETNGRASAGQQSKHIDNRYFWITDRIKQKEISIQYCPTEQMIADFLTKPLQGALFNRFRSILLGHYKVADIVEPPPSSKERVGGAE